MKGTLMASVITFMLSAEAFGGIGLNVYGTYGGDSFDLNGGILYDGDSGYASINAGFFIDSSQGETETGLTSLDLAKGFYIGDDMEFDLSGTYLPENNRYKMFGGNVSFMKAFGSEIILTPSLSAGLNFHKYDAGSILKLQEYPIGLALGLSVSENSFASVSGSYSFYNKDISPVLAKYLPSFVKWSITVSYTQYLMNGNLAIDAGYGRTTYAFTKNHTDTINADISLAFMKIFNVFVGLTYNLSDKYTSLSGGVGLNF